MACSPKDLILTEQEQANVDRYETKLDIILGKSLVIDGSVSIDIQSTNLGMNLTPKEQLELIRRYRNSGWASLTYSAGKWVFRR